MKHRILLSVVLLILGATLTYAQAIITGAGVVTADGDGTVALNGSGEVTIEGDGILFIVDRTDTATIDINSTARVYQTKQQTRGNTVYIYRRFNGTATIIGDDIAVVMNGISISVSVSGTGSMLLQGEGTVALNSKIQPWSDDGLTLAIGEVEH
jgi:hypothetical protein